MSVCYDYIVKTTNKASLDAALNQLSADTIYWIKPIKENAVPVIKSDSVFSKLKHLFSKPPKDLSVEAGNDQDTTLYCRRLGLNEMVIEDSEASVIVDW
jgi:hypothetical protein